MLPFPMTLNDPNPIGMPKFDVELLNISETVDSTVFNDLEHHAHANQLPLPRL